MVRKTKPTVKRKSKVKGHPPKEVQMIPLSNKEFRDELVRQVKNFKVDVDVIGYRQLCLRLIAGVCHKLNEDDLKLLELNVIKVANKPIVNPLCKELILVDGDHFWRGKVAVGDFGEAVEIHPRIIKEAAVQLLLKYL